MTASENTKFAKLQPAAQFAEELRAYRAGELVFGDFLARLDLELAAGISPEDILAVLNTKQAADPLPRVLHEAIVGSIDSWVLNAAEHGKDLDDAPTTVLGAAENAAPRSYIWIGDVLQARFRLVALIGEGGLSRVFKALDLRRIEAGSTEPYVAVKVLTLPLNEYFGSIAALQAEAQQLQVLTHPNIVRVFDCDRDGENVFMTMEYLAGTRLLGAAAGETPAPLEHDRAVAVIRAVGSALAYAHRNQIVHGDLKPGNVIVTNNGEVKVVDFGIARWIARPDQVPDENRKFPIAATARYASPQVMARQLPEPTDDVYALACVSYLLLTGSHAFEDGRSEDSPFPPPQLPGMTSRQYEAIVKALQYEHRNRTATVNEFIDDLEEPAPAIAAPAAVRRFPVWAGWAAVALIGLAAAWWFTHRPEQQPVRTAQSPPLVTAPAGTAPAAPTPPVAAPVGTAPVGTAPVSTAPVGTAPGTAIRDCPTCPFMTVLPSGQFMQGSAAGGKAAVSFEQPQHAVSIHYPLAMSTSEVTVADFRDFADSTHRDMRGCDVYDGAWHARPAASWKDPGFAQGNTHPVTCTSWNDAAAYAQWLSMKTGHRYRLPSASEWEYASRAGATAAVPWSGGGAEACAAANVADQTAARRYGGWSVFACSDGFVNTAPVGSFKPNAFGLNDMLGNVFEWTQDCWHDDYRGAPGDGSARLDGDCGERELRGGSWFSSPSYVTSSYRNHFAADYRTSSVGFRLVRELDP